MSLTTNFMNVISTIALSIWSETTSTETIEMTIENKNRNREKASKDTTANLDTTIKVGIGH